MVCSAALDTKSRATLRRLYASPKSGALIALESQNRVFPRGLATFIELRDQRCRTPYCDAPVRHRDHAIPHRRGRPTTAENGLGLCEQCNYVKEAAGWQVSADAVEGERHAARVTTPTGACYHSTAPPVLPGRHIVDYSEVAVALAVAFEGTTPPDERFAPPDASSVGRRGRVGRAAAAHFGGSRKVRTSQSRVIVNGNPGDSRDSATENRPPPPPIFGECGKGETVR